ncbi:hypothetical protein AB4Z14_08850 [Terrabacter sp. 2TAF16]
MRHAIVGTVLTAPVLLALRRVGQESVSARRLGGTGTTAAPSASTAH